MFPELSLTRAQRRHRRAASRDAARPSGARRLAEAQRRACATVVRLHRGSAGCASSTTARRRCATARIVHVHRKINLATYGKLDDGMYYARPATRSTLRARRSLARANPICADLWNPALVHLARAAGRDACSRPMSSAIEAVGGGFDNPSRLGRQPALLRDDVWLAGRDGESRRHARAC